MLRRSLLRRVCPDGQHDLLLPEPAVRPVWPYGAIRPVEISRLASAAARFRCRVCPGLVSARTGTAYAGIRTDATT
jgi:hypothetical protein